MKRWFDRAPRRAPVSHARPTSARPALMIALEPRIMFDAAVGATVAEVARSAPTHDTTSAGAHDVSTDHAITLPASPAATESQSGPAVLFVDSRVKDAGSLVAGAAASTQIVYLDATRDGLAQIAEYLDQHQGAGSVQILAHGASGDMWLGTTYLSAENAGEHADVLARIGSDMRVGGDILIYACETAEGDRGASFVSSLADLTGRDIAASTNRTGASGDWTLELTTGSIESVPVLSSSATAGYAYDLATQTVTNSADSGAGSLRAAITSALSGDTITFSSGMTIGLSTGQLTISKNLIIDGDINNDGVADVTLDANYRSRVLQVQAGSNVMLDGLVITRGLVSGNGGDAGSGLAAANAFGGGIWNAGTLTLLNTSVTANAAAGGGGGGGNFAYDGGGGGGGGAIGGGIGGRGGESGVSNNLGSNGSANQGGRGGADISFPGMGGQGGTSVGGAGGSYLGYSTGGTGGTATNGSISIGGGGGGLGTDATGGAGGSAAGGIYNAVGGTINVIGNSTISNNLGAGGGGGGGGAGGSLGNQNGGAGGRGVGAVWNKGVFNITAANNAAMTGNGAGSGAGGQELGTGSPGSSPAAVIGIYNDGGILNTAYVPNAPPVLGGLHGDSVTFTEGDTARLIDAGSDATVADSDSVDFNGGNVTVSITGNRIAGEDVLAIRNQGTGAGQIGISGNTVTYGGVVIGTFSGGSGTNDLVITFSSTQATPAAVEALLHNITYNNGNVDNPTASQRTVSITVNDGDGGTSTTNTVSVNVVAVNDAPTLSPANNTTNYTEGGSGVVLMGTLAITDVDSTTVQGATVVISDFRAGDVLSVGAPNGFTFSYDVGTGVLTLGGGGSLGSLQAALRSVTYSSSSHDPTFGGTDTTRQINFTVTDSGGATSTAATAQVSVTAVNDAPTLSGGPYVLTSTSEDVTSTAVTVSGLLSGMTYADADGPANGIAITSSTGTGLWQYSTDGVTWTAVGAVSNSSALLLSAGTELRYAPNGQNGETPTLTFRAWDCSAGTASTNGARGTADTTTNGGSTAYSTGTAQASLTVNSVNDAPVLTPTGPTLNGLTDTDVNSVGQAVSSFTGSNIADVDNGAVKGIAITGLNAGNGTWQYSVDGGASWQNVGTVSDGAALLLRSSDRVRFVPDGIHGTNAALTYHAWDQTGATAGLQGTKVDASSTGGATPFSTASDTASVTVTAVDDAPTLTTSGGTAAFVEGNNVSSTPVVVDSAITVSDPDSAFLYSATVQITGNFVSTQDVLAFSNNPATMGDITATYSGGLMTLTSASGATAAQWQAALRAVTYSNSSDTPSSQNRTITFQISDGNSNSTAATRVVTVAATNDTPTVAMPPSIAATEDMSVFITGISFSDADAGSAAVTVTLSVGSGTLSAASGAGVTVGGTTNALTLTGSISNINAFILGNNVQFLGVANGTGNVTLTASINDGGNSGGAAQASSATTTIAIAPVNDAPYITAVPTISVTEDVSQSITGISFGDIDAGSGIVTVQFSVAFGNGTFTALSAAGLTVVGSGTGSLSLSGTLSDINAFVATGAVSYVSAANANGNVTLNVRIDDNGNVGAGNNLIASTTVTLAIAAVNDAPVNTVPGSRSVNINEALVFSAGGGTQISISDVDAGGGMMQVTLTVGHGLLSLSGTSGLTFFVGSGTGDATMTFTGTMANINAALNGLTYMPSAGYLGADTLQITSNDQGNTGSGGAKTDTDTISLNVVDPAPTVTSVNAVVPNGTYKIGDTVTVTVSFDSAVYVNTAGGTPTLLLETGLIDRVATYVSGSGSNTLTFTYTVQAGDLTSDLNYTNTAALSLNGASIRSGDNYNVNLILPAAGGTQSLGANRDIVIDGIAPTVTSVFVPANGTYVAGQPLDFTVNFSETVVVGNGTPRIAVTLDTGGTVYADYVGGSGTSALSFRLTASAGQMDADGISIGALSLNGATLRDVAGNSATLTLNSVGSTTGVLVDAIVPTVTSVAVPTSGQYNAGDVLSFVINTSENVIVSTSGGTPRLALDVGGTTVYADYVAGSNSTTLIFQYTVANGLNDADGISISGMQLNGGTIRDQAGNNVITALTGVGNTSGVIVDTVAPTVTALDRIDPVVTNADTLRYQLVLSEDVTGLDAADFLVNSTGTATGAVSSVSQVDGHTYVITLAGVSGTGTLSLALKNAGTGIVDHAGNPLSGVLAGAAYTVDRDAPVVQAVGAPAAGTYVAGQSLDFTVQFSEAVIVDNGTPRIAVTLDTGGVVYADYVSGSGSTALTFRLAIANGQMDANGITLGSTIDLNGASIHDSVGNAVQSALHGVGNTSSVRVDAVAPTVASVAVPAAGQYNAGDVLTFTINASENVFVTTTNGTPRLVLDVGGATVYADYVSGSGTGLLTFQYVVANGQNDTNGISVSGLQLNGGSIRDAAGNAANTALNSVGNTTGVVIDTIAPTVATLDRVDAAVTNAGTLHYQLTLSEDVTGVDASDFVVTTTGTATASIASVSQVDAHTYLITLTGVSGDGNVGLTLAGSGTGIVDRAGNALTGGITGAAYRVDRVAPTAQITIEGAPGNAARESEYFVTFSENVTGVGADSFTLLTTGSAGATISSVRAVDAHTYIVTVSDIHGAGSIALQLNGGHGIADIGGNTLAASAASATRTIDTQPFAPPPTIAAPPLPPLVVTPPQVLSTPLIVTTATDATASSTSTDGTGAPTISGMLAGSNTMLDAWVSEDTRAQPVATSRPTGDAGPARSDTLQSMPDLGVQRVSPGEPVDIAVPRNAFSLSDANATVTVTAALADGRPLPAWLRFDPVTGTLSGRPPAGWKQAMAIEISARDAKGNRVSTVIRIEFDGAEPAQRSAALERALTQFAHAPAAGRTGLDAQFASHGQRAFDRDMQALLDALGQLEHERA